MSTSARYAAVEYKRSSMQRVIVGVSHSIKALRRRHPAGHVFRVEVTPMAGSLSGLKDYKIVGKEIPEVYHRIAAVKDNPSIAGTLADPAVRERAIAQLNGAPIRRAADYRRRYRRKIKRETAA